MRRWICLAVLLLGGQAEAQLPSEPGEPVQQPPTRVQPPPPPLPKGPRDIIVGAKQAAEKKRMSEATRRGADPTSPEGTAVGADARPANPHDGASSHAGAAGSAPPRPLSAAVPNPELPVGSIRVRVVDSLERPVAGASLRLGIMQASGERSSENAKTGFDGTYTFKGLETGERRSYRANVTYNGAKYGSTPFRLPQTGGYDVVLRRLETTRSEKRVVLYMGAASIELKDERLKVVQQMRLVNVGERTHVFGDEGKLIELPEAFMGFQSQDVMGDQRLVEEPGKGLRLMGSLPPGEVTLLWGFDLPVEGSEASFSLAVPWTAFAYRVVADAAPGMGMEVQGMPEPEEHVDVGRRYLVTEVRRRIGDPPMGSIRVRLHDIPGPGPMRWVAAVLALVVLGFGGLLSRRQVPAQARDLNVERQALIGHAAELDAQRATGEIGPEYHARRKSELVTELAVLLRDEDLAGALAKPTGAGKTVS